MLEVDPNELPGVGGKLTMHYADLTKAILATAQAVSESLATPMGADQTSMRAQQHFIDHGSKFYTSTNDGAAKWLRGAHLIVPVSQEYADVDGVGGGQVADTDVTKALTAQLKTGGDITSITGNQVDVTVPGS